MLAKRLIHGLSLSMDSEEAMINKLKVTPGRKWLIETRHFNWSAASDLVGSFLLAASLWLRVHEQAAQNVHGHERERRPQQQVQQLHQDAGHGGGPGHQLPNLRLAGECTLKRRKGLLVVDVHLPSLNRTAWVISRRRQKPHGGQDFYLLRPLRIGLDLTQVGSRLDQRTSVGGKREWDQI